MGWGFRRSFKLAPGVRINLSRSGISTSLGGRGATVNVSRRGTRATVGIPGTGLSFSQHLRRAGGGGGGASNDAATQAGGCMGVGCLGLLVLMLIGMCGAPNDPPPSPATPAPRLYSPPDTTPAVAEEREWFYIHGELNVRAEPRRDADHVRTLKRGDLVQLGPKDESGWARLYNAGRVEGYVYRASSAVQSEAPSRGISGSGGGSRRSSGGRVYHTGPRGGCYYYSGSGRKQYVDRSYCN